MKKSKHQVTKTQDFKKIILPVDGSDGSTRAVEKALNFAKETGVDVTALHVLKYPDIAIGDFSYTYPDIMESIKKRGNEVLDEIKKQGSKIGVNVKTKLLEGIPDDQIIKEAKKNDLIIMGCKGRTALSRILIGSVCEKVVHHSKSPVMVIR